MKHAIAVSALLALAACTKPQQAARTNEAPDPSNSVDLFNIDKVFTYTDLRRLTSIATPTVPWTDTYWPLAAQGMAWRWMDRSDAVDSGEEVKLGQFLREFAGEALKPEPAVWLSPAEKYDLLFNFRHDAGLTPELLTGMADRVTTTDATLRGRAELSEKRGDLKDMRRVMVESEATRSLSWVAEGWNTFLANSSKEDYQYLAGSDQPGEDWWWMGHCHGWAAAAVMPKAPKHAVQAVFGTQKVLFTEGDIRGLLTKAWADHAPDEKQLFLGRRCNENVADPNSAIAANAKGKGITGVITAADGTKTDFVVTESMPLLVQYNVTVFRARLEPAGTETFILERGGTHWQIGSLTELADAAATNFSTLASADVKMYGCWDVNPASFHTVLIEQLNERKQGFVMDRTRSGQVWNQPIYAARFNIGPLRNAAEITDVAADYRASGTVYVAQVRADVRWTSEPPTPAVSYRGGQSDIDQLQNTRYEYTLEFDAQKRLIGGEWGTFEDMNPAGKAPDFLYAFAADSVPNNALAAGPGDARLDYEGIVAKLLACSQTETTNGSQVVNGRTVRFQACPIDKVGAVAPAPAP